MVYLSSFKLSDRQMKDPNIYPYSVFRSRSIAPFVFSPVTVLYGNNGSGKSTILNIIALCLSLKGREYPTSNSFGRVDYLGLFCRECSYDLGEYEDGQPVRKIPGCSRYIKSEDILYEIKKVEQKHVLEDGLVYDLMREKEFSGKKAEEFLKSREMWDLMERISFAQEKYSNGETALMLLDDLIQPDGLYLLDEPEVSLAPQNQVKTAEQINRMAQLLGCQFIVATHSPFMLGTLHGRIYDLDSPDVDIREWTDLENVRYFFDFFQKHAEAFS